MCYKVIPFVQTINTEVFNGMRTSKFTIFSFLFEIEDTPVSDDD